MKSIILRIYDIAIDAIAIGLVSMMLVMLVFAFLDVLGGLIQLMPTLTSVTLNDIEFRDLISSVLDVFVIIELFSTFIDYVKDKRIRLYRLIDVTAVFILRDMLVKLYRPSVSSNELLTLALLLMVMVIARSITSRLPPKIPQQPD
ncbi:MAG: phosphate-starvation-inducible PsiE family protein [Salinisphaera sp.]|nr:phosphate-starvation-inducible PsiE family protein [Salinisphaera sp.]